MDILSNIRHIGISCLVISLSIFGSCKKLIEIPVNPPTGVIREQLFADSATALSAVAGVYSLTPGGAGLPYQDAYFTICTSLSGHEIAVTGNDGDFQQFYSYTVTPVNAEINTIWTAHYTEIYQINDILENIKDNTNLPGSFIRQITGEMKFVRAFCYFNLVNLFGGVPLVTTTDYRTNARLPRSTTPAVYAQILADLDQAVQLLTETFPSEGHIRANRYTAQALLAKVHLFTGQWQAAYNEADSVIKSGDFSLLTDLNGVFLDGSNEAVWQVPILNTVQGSREAAFFLPNTTTTTPFYVITDSLLAQFESGDLRKSAWMGVNIVNGQNVYYPAKYKDKQHTSPETDFMLLRFAEMYLIRAEAAAQLNLLDQAILDINVIRQRAGLAASTVDPTSQTAVLLAVMKERRTEMFTEFASRWFSINRISTDSKYPKSVQAPAVLPGWQPFCALYPIARTQISLNNTLMQNPGYH